MLGIARNVGNGVLARYVATPFCLLHRFPSPKTSNTIGGTGAHMGLRRPGKVKLGHVGGSS